ncbi:MAG: adenylosuccinate synthase [Bacteroidetes bacterium]|nr:adenylosuccinate synthase [Bacteroidota bacterium]
MVDVILGLQWGDEGKGKIVDFLAPNYDIIARFQGGPNAGHSLEFDGHKVVLNTIPSGIFQSHCINIIGNGVVIDPILLRKEIEKITPICADIKKRLLISKKAHLILPSHRTMDAASEAAKGALKIGSTLRGITPTYQDKTGRNGLRIGDIFTPGFTEKYKSQTARHTETILALKFDFDNTELEKEWFAAIEFIKQFTCIDSEYYINQALREGKKILAEGAQGSMLDIDFGTYPFVTSSNTLTSGVCTGLGVAPKHIGEVYGIFKAYCTRVGSGPFPTELDNDMGELLRQKGHEFGATTGRPRRTGWIDLPQLNYTIMLNGVTQLVMTKADVLNGFNEIFACEAYEINGSNTTEVPYDLCDVEITPVLNKIEGWSQQGLELPPALDSYIHYLETKLSTPIKIVSLGPDRKATLFR